MAINLMAGRDGQDADNNKKQPAQAKQEIDLTLERKNVESGVISGKVGVPKTLDKADSQPTESTKIDIKDMDKSAGAAIPEDLSSMGELESGSWGGKLIGLIIVLLVIGAGVLLYLLNAESQFLKGSVNEIPTSNTNIVDDILAEDFSNEADTGIDKTEIDPQAEVLNQANEIINESNAEVETELPSANEPVTSPVAESEPVIEVLPTTEPVVSVNTPEPAVDNDQIISEYDLQSGPEIAETIIAQTEVNSGNETDFTPQQSNTDTTVQPEVAESPEISGETGPGLWLCVMLTALFTYVRYGKNKFRIQ